MEASEGMRITQGLSELHSSKCKCHNRQKKKRKDQIEHKWKTEVGKSARTETLLFMFLVHFYSTCRLDKIRLNFVNV